MKTNLRIKARNKRPSLSISISYNYVAQRFTKICSTNNLFVLLCLSATMMDFKWNQTGRISKFRWTLWRFPLVVVIIIIVFFISAQPSSAQLSLIYFKWLRNQLRTISDWKWFPFSQHDFFENRRMKKLISRSLPIRFHILIIIQYSFHSNTNLTQIGQL